MTCIIFIQYAIIRKTMCALTFWFDVAHLLSCNSFNYDNFSFFSLQDQGNICEASVCR